MSLRLKDGLNVPQINRQTPLDRVFSEVERFLAVEEGATKPSALDQLSTKISSGGGTAVAKMSLLLEHCFAYIHEIQRLSLEASAKQRASNHPQKAHLITISLHDMRFFNELVNVVICQCIYPCFPLGVGIPIDQRRLKTFGTRMKLFRFERIRTLSEETYGILQLAVTHFERVFNQGGDVCELLVKGSGMTDALTAQMVLVQELGQVHMPVYIQLEQRTEPYTLFGIYTSLIQACRVPKYNQFISARLTHTTINRPTGVINLIDFVVGLRDDEEINIEKFNNVNRLLLSKPKEIPSVEYFTKLFDQIYEILVFINRPVMTSVVVNFIRVLYEKNKRIIHDFLFKRVWKALAPEVTGNEKPGDTLTTEKQLNDSINVLISLSKETSPEFLNELFYPIHLNLWCYYFYLKKKKLEYHTIISNVLTSFFTVTSNNEFLEDIVLNLINSQGDGWKFQTTLENKLTSIVKSGPLDQEITSSQILDDIDVGIEVLIELLKNLSNEVVRHQFLTLLNRWILKQSTTTTLLADDDDSNPFIMLIDLKLLEKINEVFKEVLMEKPENVLLVIKNLLSVKFDTKVEEEEEEREVDSDDEDEEEDTQQHDNLTIVLELLSAIMTEAPTSELSKHKETLQEISTLLMAYTQNKHCMSLHSRIEDFLQGNVTIVDDELTKDKELFEKAIASMNDPLIPIRAHGLYLLRQLIAKKSEVLTLEFVLELHVLQLQDQEPFIYLNVIKSFNELIGYDKEGTLNFLITYYGNKKEKLDNRLKIGEVINQFIDSSGEMLQGSLCDQLISQFLQVVRDFDEDNRMRMSAMSLIGESLRTNAQALEKFIKDSLDCAIGILEMERKEAIMQRSAVVLIADLISFGGLEIVPRGYGGKIKRTLEYSMNHATDYLLLEQIQKVLSVIDELIKEKFTGEMPSQFDSLKIKTHT